jgi:NAD(P)-dependent dehydrogenase (short-subunit alcohol dehydrogenase family)
MHVDLLHTGTSSGIGRRTALFLAKQGFVVLAGVRKQADGDALVKEGGSNIRPVILDVAVQSSIDECFKRVVALLKEQALPLVCVINNAGLLQDATVEFHDLAQMKTMFDVNYYGLVAVTQKFLPLIRKSKGRIINIGSVAGVYYPLCVRQSRIKQICLHYMTPPLAH